MLVLASAAAENHFVADIAVACAAGAALPGFAQRCRHEGWLQAACEDQIEHSDLVEYTRVNLLVLPSEVKLVVEIVLCDIAEQAIAVFSFEDQESVDVGYCIRKESVAEWGSANHVVIVVACLSIHAESWA